MSIRFRPGTLDDSPKVYRVFFSSIVDLARRSGHLPWQADQAPPDPEAVWPRRRSIFEHLALTAEAFWVAEVEEEIIGYARSIRREGVLQLTEFFVTPAHQSSGVGGELFRRAFPEGGARQRLIIGTGDARALPRYLKAGLTPLSPVGYLHAAPRPAPVSEDLEFSPIEPESGDTADLDRIDRAVLGFVRPEDHGWFRRNLSGFMARRAGQAVGYAYLGEAAGPLACVDPGDLTALLAFAENQALGRVEEFGAEVPLTNRSAVAYLLGRDFRLSGLLTHFLCDGPGIHLDRYLFPSPPFFT